MCWLVTLFNQREGRFGCEILRFAQDDNVNGDLNVRRLVAQEFWLGQKLPSLDAAASDPSGHVRDHRSYNSSNKRV
jgi:hypothetical protein